ncbi:MAG: hypothetical protein ABFD01_05745 [Candidatus Cloacimonas sp.]
MKKIILMAIAVVAVISSVQAAPFQTLGMLRTPDAYVLPNKAAEFVLVGYYRDIAAPKPLTNDAKDASEGLFPYTMIGVGILDRVELGLFLGDYTSLDKLVYYLNAKVKIIEETLRIPQVSIGMDNILSPVPKHGSQYLSPGDDFSQHPDADCYEPYSPYAVASKQAVFLGIPWMFNVGIGSNRFVGQAKSRYLNGLFASAEMSPIKDLALQGEFDGEDLNIGAKYSYNNFGFKVGVNALEDWFKDSDYKDNIRIAFGVSYLFDKYAEAKRRPDLGHYAGYGKTPSMGEGVVETPIETGITVPPTVSPSKPQAGTQTPAPGLTTSGTAGYEQLSPEVQELMKELRMLKEDREKAQQAMDELRKWIEELKKQKQ